MNWWPWSRKTKQLPWPGFAYGSGSRRFQQGHTTYSEVLAKSGRLTAREYKEITQHPLIGAQIIATVPYLAEIAPIVEYHHERFDGSGYGSGLRGDAIPIESRILAVAEYKATVDQVIRNAAETKEKFSLTPDEATSLRRITSTSHTNPAAANIKKNTSR